MNRQLPVWFFLFCVLLGLLFIMVFGWALRTTMLGNDRSGVFGRAAVAIAEFPSTTRQVLTEVMGFATGDFADQEVSIKREKDPEAAGFEWAAVAPSVGLQLPAVAVRATENTRPGWRFVAGTFGIDGDPTHAAILLSPELEITNVWPLTEELPEGSEIELRPRHRKFPHGVELLPDGSVVAAFDGGRTLQRVNSCGIRQWSIAQEFHHALTLEENGETVWGLNSDFEGWGDSLAEVRLSDGKILRQISMNDIKAANPMIDILGARRVDREKDDPVSNRRNTKGRQLTDPYHLNDVDPLPPSLASAFPMFDAGDLLVSARTLNMIFVVDPDTAEVKWWRAGAVRRQHDPDWLPTGEISVYDNRMGKDFSRVVAFDPSSFGLRTVFDGDETSFFSRVRGKHQIRPDGTLVITSPQQGYAFETANDGSIAFELVNGKPGSTDENYVLSELRWFDESAVNPKNWVCE